MRTLFFIAIAVFMLSSVAQAANYLQIQVGLEQDAADKPFESGSSLPLSMGSDQRTVNVTVSIMDDNSTPNDKTDDTVSAATDSVKLEVFCGADTSAKANQSKAAASGVAAFAGWVMPASDASDTYGTTGDLCKFKASATVSSTALTAEFPFVLGCPEAHCMSVRGGVIKSGQLFTLDNLNCDEPGQNDTGVECAPPENKLTFGDVRVENCTAGSDPELFIATNSGIERAYPVITGSTANHPTAKLRSGTDGGWGKVDNMFFIGSGAGCNFTFHREAIIGGNNFTTSCSLNLASDAAVTASNNKIMLALGTKPTGAANEPTVYVSANGGYTWQTWGGSPTAWGTTAQDSSIAANSDNTKNRALVKVTHTDGSVCWNVVNGA